MEKIRFDFEFGNLSLELGQFLTLVHEEDPDICIERVDHHYAYNRDLIRVSIEVDGASELAVMLKLKLGAHIRLRPLPPKDKENIGYDVNLNIIKGRNTNKNTIEYYHHYNSLEEITILAQNKFE